jgi:hypothetical protein
VPTSSATSGCDVSPDRPRGVVRRPSYFAKFDGRRSMGDPGLELVTEGRIESI